MIRNLFFTILILYSAVGFSQVKAYKGLYFGMTKSEAKSEFQKNKEEYTTAQIGGFLYRLYTQNNKYDNQGRLFQIGFVAKGSGMTGVLEFEAMDRLRDFVRFAKENNYTTDGVTIGSSEFEFNRNGEYLFISPEKDKFMKLVFLPNGEKWTFLTLWVGSYSEDNKMKTYKTDDFD
jgi:hypothetical protein